MRLGRSSIKDSACVDGLLLSTSKVLAEELGNRVENGEEKFGNFSCLRRSLRKNVFAAKPLTRAKIIPTAALAIKGRLTFMYKAASSLQLLQRYIVII